MKRRDFSVVGVVLLSCVFYAFSVKENASVLSRAFTVPPVKPNIIVIMLDDLGYNDVSFNGSTQISTPNIDRIASQGVKCTNAYVSYSVCGPSRAGFMTGRYPQRFGFERNPIYEPDLISPGLPLTERTIAEALPSNYNTGIIGKWHMGAHVDNHPLNRGFDEFYGHLGGGHRYFPEELTIQDSYSIHTESESYITKIMQDHSPVDTDKYLTEEFSEEAVSFVQSHAADTDPFFLFLSYNAPHGPLQATQKYLDRFPNLSGNRKIYAAMISAVDDGVGDLLDELETLDIDDNTIVFFLSDNGGKTSYSDNAPLRGGKSSSYEGGFHVPFAVQYKGTVSPGVYNKPVSALDIFATALAVSGGVEDPNKPLDGVNLIPYFTNENTNKPHNEIYLRKFDQQRYAVRKDCYKLVSFFNTGKHELYDLNNDISETINIYNDRPDLVDELSLLRENWTSQLMNPVFKGITDPLIYDSKSPSEYLINHGFEMGNLTGWNDWGNATTNSANNVNSGNHSGVVLANKTGSLKHEMELKSNTSYQLKFKAKSQVSGEVTKLIVKDEVTNAKFLNDEITTTTSYQEFVKTFTTSNEKNVSSFSLWKHISGNSNFYADDFEIIEIGSSPNQLRLKNEALTEMKEGGLYQASAVEIPLTAWLGAKKWEIVNGTGSATIDTKGVITAISEGTVTLKVSALENSMIYDEIELTIAQSLGLDDFETETLPFSIMGTNIVDNEITIESNYVQDNVSIKIFSLDGNVLFQKQYPELSKSIYKYSLVNSQSGLYFILLKTKNKSHLLKFIKK